MKTLFSFSRLRVLLLCASLTVACCYVVSGADCLAKSFSEIMAKVLLEDVSKKLKAKTEQVLNSPRWAALAASERESAALIELQQSLCAAQEEAKKAGKSIGGLTAKEQASVLTGNKVLGNNRTPLENAGKGVGNMSARPEVSDSKLKDGLHGMETVTTGRPASDGNPAIAGHSTYTGANYTSSEALGDYNYLHESNPNLPAGDMFTKKLPSGDVGAPGEIGMAKRIQRNQPNGVPEKVLHLGPDSDPNHLLYGDARGGLPAKPTGIDTLTDKHMYNMALNSDTLKGKFQDSSELLARINNAMAVYEADQALAPALRTFPAGMRYKFGYGRQLQNGWKPVLDDGITFAPFVQAVNDALPPNRKLAVSDFILLDLANP